MLSTTVRPGWTGWTLALGLGLFTQASLAAELFEAELRAMDSTHRYLEAERNHHMRLKALSQRLVPGVSQEHWEAEDRPTHTQWVYVGGRIDAAREFGIEDLFSFFPAAWIEDTNRRLYLEYDRGYRDWLEGGAPPAAHLESGMEAQRAAYHLFDRWSRNEARDGDDQFRAAQHLRGLLVRPDRRAGTEGITAYQEAAAALPSRRAAVEAAIEAAESYGRILQSRPGGWLPLRRDTDWTNADDWFARVEVLKAAFHEYTVTLNRARSHRTRALGELVARRLEYHPGPSPRLLIDGAGPTTEATASSWSSAYDAQVLDALAGHLERLLREKLVAAYFDGAEAAKYGWEADRHAPPEGLDDDLIDREYQATLTGNSAGDPGARTPRTPRAWGEPGATSVEGADSGGDLESPPSFSGLLGMGTEAGVP